MHYKRVMVVGLGLIGGSIARVIRRRFGADVYVMGVDVDLASVQFALESGIVDEGSVSIGGMSVAPDVVWVCTPISVVAQTVVAVANAYPSVSVISDVASVKSAINVSREALGGVLYVPGHPMAGTEKSGILNSDADIVEGATYMLSLQSDVRYEGFRDMLVSLGFRVVEMDEATHDRVVAAVSHVPYVMACLTVGNAQSQPESLQELVGQLKSSGYRDTTRVAGSDPSWGVEVCVHNREAVMAQLVAVRDALTAVIGYVDASDEEALLAYLRGVCAYRVG